MAKEPQAIRFTAQIFKIATIVDGGIRLTLDIQADTKTVVELMCSREPGVLLEIAAVKVSAETLINLDKNENNKTRSKNGAPVVDSGRFIKHGDQ